MNSQHRFYIFFPEKIFFAEKFCKKKCSSLFSSLTQDFFKEESTHYQALRKAVCFFKEEGNRKEAQMASELLTKYVIYKKLWHKRSDLRLFLEKKDFFLFEVIMNNAINRYHYLKKTIRLWFPEWRQNKTLFSFVLQNQERNILGKIFFANFFYSQKRDLIKDIIRALILYGNKKEIFQYAVNNYKKVKIEKSFSPQILEKETSSLFFKKRDKNSVPHEFDLRDPHFIYSHLEDIFYFFSSAEDHENLKIIHQTLCQHQDIFKKSPKSRVVNYFLKEIERISFG